MKLGAPFRYSEGYTRDQNVTILKRYDDEYYKLIHVASVRKKGFVPVEDKKEKICTGEVAATDRLSRDKLDNNLSRTKSKIFELAYCNHWDWFFTGTIAPEKGFRDNLNLFKKKLGQFLNNYNKRNPDYPVKYILIPEQHKDGCWHIHGLLTGINPKDLYTNANGFLSWRQYDKAFGYMSISAVKDKTRCAAYITKYITKDVGQGVGYGRHAFFLHRV